MALTTRHIIALQKITGFGDKTVRTMVELSENVSIDTDKELWTFINEVVSSGKLPRLKKPLDYDAVASAIAMADSILERSERLDIKAVSFKDPEFPKNLLSTIDESGQPSVPIILYYKGDISITKRKGVAIIGTREPTSEGIQAGLYFGKILAEQGYNLVSGHAIGCDAAGHKGALSAEGGVTTAFLAHGLDSVYPEENRQLAQNIIDNGGLLMSEYEIGKGINRYNIVGRDRLQAALADATIVIQSSEKGGTMHAANTTLLANKPLFCVKYKDYLGSNEKVKGNTLLTTKGARWLSSANALLDIESLLNPKQPTCTSNEIVTEGKKNERPIQTEIQFDS